jgi:hypothetical protein
MSEIQVIETALAAAARRRRWARASRGLWVGLMVGAALSLLLDGAYHVLPLPSWTPLAVALAACPCALAGLAVGGWPQLAPSQVARWVDGRERLKERLSTALELAAAPSPEGDSAWRDLVLADAADHARRLDARQLAPLRLPQGVVRWVLVLLAAEVGLGFVPQYRSRSYLQKQKEQQVVQETGRQLAELTRRNLERRPPALEVTRKDLESVSDLGDRLSKVSLSRTEALKELANVTDRLKDELKELGKDPAIQRLEQAARAAGTHDADSAAALQKQIESLRNQLGAPTGHPEELQKLKKELEKLQETAKGLNDKSSLGTAAQRQELSQALSALSRQAQDLGLQVPALSEAIQALEQSNPGLFLKDLQTSLTDLQKLQDMSKNLQQLQQQAEKLGKDLAEQLKNGQPEAAQKTLEKMAQQLRSGNLTAEQLQKIMQEVQQAVQPAANYGNLQSPLKNAAQQMAKGDKAAAAQSIAAAAAELQRLAAQMGDAQSLAAELDALNQAALAIGTGQGWKAGNAHGRPAMGQGGRPGTGVGTWAEEDAQWDGQWNERWDNTGVTQPDREPRGHTDRGEGELTEALRPTKVSGQFSPGSPMPSITLRDLSIKGQSKVDYQAAAATAQSDAQSALTHDQVPRAYQGAVKDYFDDLNAKK